MKPFRSYCPISGTVQVEIREARTRALKLQYTQIRLVSGHVEIREARTRALKPEKAIKKYHPWPTVEIREARTRALKHDLLSPNSISSTVEIREARTRALKQLHP